MSTIKSVTEEGVITFAMLLHLRRRRNPRRIQLTKRRFACTLFLITSMIAGISFDADIAHADISSDWIQEKEKQRLEANSCQEKWNNANYVDPQNENTQWRWSVTKFRAIRISPGRCHLNLVRRIGKQQSAKCIDESAVISGIISERESRDSPKIRYDCIMLLKLEGSDLVEYRKSNRFGLERRVVGVLLPGAFNPE